MFVPKGLSNECLPVVFEKPFNKKATRGRSLYLKTFLSLSVRADLGGVVSSYDNYLNFFSKDKFVKFPWVFKNRYEKEFNLNFFFFMKLPRNFGYVFTSNNIKSNNYAFMRRRASSLRKFRNNSKKRRNLLRGCRKNLPSYLKKFSVIKRIPFLKTKATSRLSPKSPFFSLRRSKPLTRPLFKGLFRGFSDCYREASSSETSLEIFEESSDFPESEDFLEDLRESSDSLEEASPSSTP